MSEDTNDKGTSVGYAGKDAATSAILVKGEELLLQAQIHPAIYWKPVAVLIFALLLALKVPTLGALLGVAGLMMLATATLTKHFLLLALTNKRVLSRYGILQVDVVGIAFSKIESIETERMLPGQIFNYATVVIMGTGNRMIRIPFIGNATEFRRAYDEVTLKSEEN